MLSRGVFVSQNWFVEPWVSAGISADSVVIVGPKEFVLLVTGPTRVWPRNTQCWESQLFPLAAPIVSVINPSASV